MLDKKLILYPLITIMIIATIYSFFTYVPGIFYLPWYLMIFKPLCPTYIGLFTALLIIYAFKKEFPKGFTELAFIVVFSLGITSGVFYALWLSSTGFSYYHLNNLVSHPFLLIGALMLIPHLKKLKLYQYLLIWGWIVLDFYFLISLNLFSYFNDPRALSFRVPVVILMAALIIITFSITLFIPEKTT